MVLKLFKRIPRELIDRLRPLAESEPPYAEPIAYDTLDKTKEKVESGGFTPKTREIDAMRNDMHVCAYEFLQNLSYGLGYKPNPAIFFRLTDGSRIPFTGNPEDYPDNNLITDIEFITGCTEGITVSESVISGHDEAKEQGLGYWGRGLKHASVFLLEQYERSHGTSIEIQSTYTHGQTKRREAFVGRYQLDLTADGRNRKLNMHYIEVGPQDVTQTIVTIRKPPEDFIDAIKESPDVFLYTNPNYRGGIFLPGGKKDHTQGVCLETEIDGLQVEILDPSVLARQQYPYTRGYVDGTMFATTYHHDSLMFPWHFSGGLKSDVDSRVKITRGEDSNQVRNLDNLPILLRRGLNKGALGVQFWEEFLEKMYEGGFCPSIEGGTIENLVIPIELREISGYYSEEEKLTPQGERILKQAWTAFRQKHPEIKAYANSKHTFSDGKIRHEEYQRPDYRVFVPAGLANILMKMGIDLPELKSLQDQHRDEAALEKPPIAEYNLQPICEVAPVYELPENWQQACFQLGYNPELRATVNPNTGTLEIQTNEIESYFNKDFPQWMFPKNQQTKQDLFKALEFLCKTNVK